MKTILIISALLVLNIGKAQTLSESDLLYYFSLNLNGINATNVSQIGNENYAQIQASQISLNQIGDNQQFYYTESSLLPSNFNVNVEGHNTYVEIIGNNQILDNMTINIQGDNRNVIIRNYP